MYASSVRVRVVFGSFVVDYAAVVVFFAQVENVNRVHAGQT